MGKGISRGLTAPQMGGTPMGTSHPFGRALLPQGPSPQNTAQPYGISSNYPFPLPQYTNGPNYGGFWSPRMGTPSMAPQQMPARPVAQPGMPQAPAQAPTMPASSPAYSNYQSLLTRLQAGQNSPAYQQAVASGQPFSSSLNPLTIQEGRDFATSINGDNGVANDPNYMLDPATNTYVPRQQGMPNQALSPYFTTPGLFRR